MQKSKIFFGSFNLFKFDCIRVHWSAFGNFFFYPWIIYVTYSWVADCKYRNHFGLSRKGVE